MGFVLKQTNGNSGSLDFQDVSNYGIPAIFKASIHHVSSYQDQLNGAFVFGAVTMVMNVPQKGQGQKICIVLQQKGCYPRKELENKNQLERWFEVDCPWFQAVRSYKEWPGTAAMVRAGGREGDEGEGPDAPLIKSRNPHLHKEKHISGMIMHLQPS